eukprot:CAMPEP_0119053544 /NCGR_PEP_ID=MMETSP1177-20130426/74495_1 /TAXON_ID=2985 /ORGANISM="Ochromonas sp, Strain CCMP1899" /LENGTH=1024 /DNA_ID=CAMNT_0007033523 /DNA_START=272 /DNA_END=3346 /DNA_ORIENTATION=-
MPFTFSLPSINVNVMVLYDTIGDEANRTDIHKLAPVWESYINNKTQTDATYPFTITVEAYETASDCQRVNSTLVNRLSNASLPRITTIVAEGDNCARGALSATIAHTYGIPIILTTYSPDSITNAYKMPEDQGTSFLMSGPTFAQFKELIKTYKQTGIKTVVAVAANHGNSNYDVHSCMGGADELELRGIEVLGRFIIERGQSTDRVMDIVLEIKGLNPDAVIWCDRLMCESLAASEEFLPMQSFKDANYLPKALSILDCLDSDAVPDKTLLQYVSAPNYVNNMIVGFEYTEDDYPFSNMFRPDVPENLTAGIQMGVGDTIAIPSSTYLFYTWFSTKYGYTPTYTTVMVWAAFDVLEKALYIAALTPQSQATSFVSPLDAFVLLSVGHCSTPFGLISFDANRINTGSVTIFIQAFHAEVDGQSDDDNEIVSPSTLETGAFLYPMPTWEERIYVWTLISTVNEIRSVAVAGVLNVILIAIIITVYIHRNDVEIRMLHYMHIILLCLMAMAFCWGNALLYQGDMLQRQCDSYLWVIFLSGSFFLSIVNMKAYRLSIFLKSSTNGRRPKPFSHGKVLKYTMVMVGLTAILLLVIALADQPKSIRIIVDVYRPVADYHECPWGSITTALLTIIIVAHFLFSVYCIAAVRNGMESFSDGTIIKESLIAFYFCLAIGIMLTNIGLEHKLSDFIRSLFFNIGATLFCVRLMANRVFKYWLPEGVQKYLNQGYAFYKTIWPTTATNSVNNQSAENYDDMTGDCPVYQQRTIQLGDINELVTAMEDPSRLKILRNLALKNHLVENVDFICGVLRFKEEAEQLIMTSSGAASDEMKTQAMAMWYQYLQINSPDEVNVSSTAREMLKTQLDHWAPNVKLVSKLAARGSLEADAEHRLIIFESAYREILTMLYQNLWTKFRIEEAQALTLEDGDNDSMMHLFSKDKAKHKSSGKSSSKVASERSSVTLLCPISEGGDKNGVEGTNTGNPSTSPSISSWPAFSERSASEAPQMNREEIDLFMKEKEAPPSDSSGSEK